jgi:hypothetical protein
MPQNRPKKVAIASSIQFDKQEDLFLKIRSRLFSLEKLFVIGGPVLRKMDSEPLREGFFPKTRKVGGKKQSYNSME